MRKPFKLHDSDIRVLAPGYGACFVSDKITVDGRRVGYMYRQTPDSEVDSGWRFLAGDESEDYINDPDNIGMVDVNTVANYDRDIIPLLDAPTGAAFERNARGNLVVTVAPEDDNLTSEA